MGCIHELANTKHPLDAYSSFSAAVFFAFAPLSLDSGASFFGVCDLRMADARATACARRSERYPDLAVLLTMVLYVL
jgi:hypothetical protein